MSITIGIDFGTTKTLVSYYDEDRQEAKCIRLGRGKDHIPTSIYVNNNGQFFFGDDADDEMNLAPERYCKSFKLKLGYPSPVLAFIQDHKYYTAKELTSAYLKYIRETCEQLAFMGQHIGGAVISHPVAFSPAQRSELIQAAQIAGFHHVQLVTEPEAAGLAFCTMCPKDSFTGQALVVDWGGGTLDMALVSRQDKRIIIHSEHSEGDVNMGGETFDDKLWTYVCSRLKQESGILVDEESFVMRNQMLEKIRKVKEKLSYHDEYELTFCIDNKACPALTLRRADLENIIRPTVENAARMADSLINKIEKKSLKPEMLLLVGGSSRVPLIKNVLEKHIGLPAKLWQYSKEAVSLGNSYFIEKVEQSPAFKKLHQRAKAGDSNAQYMVGDIYCGGYWSCYNLAERYETGNGVEKDISEAKALYLRALKNGLPCDCPTDWAKIKLRELEKNYHDTGVRFLPSLNIPFSSEDALWWYEKSADQGNYWGGFNLAKCYELGIGNTPIDLVKAFEIYERTSHLSLPSGPGGGENYALIRANALREVCHSQHDADTQFKIGDMYYNGHGVEQSYQQAFLWYSKSAAQNNYWGIFNVAKCYEHGHGVKANTLEAKKLYIKASEVGKAFSMNPDWAKIRANALSGEIPQNLYYWRDMPNFGDALNPILLRYLKIPYKLTYSGEASLICIGSILEHVQNEHDGAELKVFGSGFLWPPSNNDDKWLRPNTHFIAVRGKETRARLQEMTGQSLEDTVLGDPGLLVARMFPFVECHGKYDLGVICHWKDKNSDTLKNICLNKCSLKFIDVFQAPEQFVQDVSSCKFILSSALHGLICADALGVPNRHLILGNEVEGGSYKIRDYYSAYDEIEYEGLDLRYRTIRDEDLDGLVRSYKITSEQVNKICDRLEKAARQIVIR